MYYLNMYYGHTYLKNIYTLYSFQDKLSSSTVNFLLFKHFPIILYMNLYLHFYISEYLALTGAIKSGYQKKVSRGAH